MSTFAESAATWHTLSITAMEEAVRVGQRTADIDHLLLALTLSEQTAGQVLRAEGVTVDAVRAAIAQQHAEQLADLGVRAPEVEPSPVRLLRADSCAWSDRADALMSRSIDGTGGGDAGAVLRELLIEPSGLIRAILDRMDVDPQRIAARLDELDAHPVHRALPAHRPDALEIMRQVFVPAAPADVWELLSSPQRFPEWEPGIGATEQAPETSHAGDSFTARARTTGPDGKPVRTRPELVEQRVEIVTVEAPRRIAWRFAYPQFARSNTRFLDIEIEPAAGGSRLNLTHAWERSPARPRDRQVRLLGRAVRAMYRPVLWLQASQIGAGISRAVR